MKKRPGRPSKFTPATVRKILRSVARGMPLVHSANAAGMSFQTLCTHRGKHPEFDDALAQAAARGLESRLKKIEEAAKTDWRAAAWYAEHVFPEHFSRTRIQVEAIGQFDHAFVIPRETLDQIAEARAKHDRETLNGNGSPPVALPDAKTPAATAP